MNTSGSFHDHFKEDLSHIGFDSATTDKEILEPTLANLKRMELRNQRRGIESSIVSSSINNIISNHTGAKSIHNFGSERSFGSGQGKIPTIAFNPTTKLGGSQFKFGAIRP